MCCVPHKVLQAKIILLLQTFVSHVLLLILFAQLKFVEKKNLFHK